MSGTFQRTNPPAAETAKPAKPAPPPAPIEDNDINDGDGEDGDIATPKRDRYGTDDEPL